MKKSIYKLMGIVLVATAMVVVCGQQQAVAQTHAGNVTIDGSLAVGNDTLSPTNFGFDTIRLRENNLRIHFDDTSVAAAFPRNDWRIVINDSANGGQSHFSIDDATEGTTPFRVEAGAPSFSLFVEENSGDVGIGTGNPAIDLQVTRGDTPSLRLEQNTSSGFSAQSWDVAGNEASFFIRDATNGSTLPFRIRPGAPSSSIDIEGGTGDVGVGTASPAASVHVRRTNQTAQILVEEDSGTTANRDLLELRNNGGAQLLLTNDNVPGNPGKWRVVSNATGDFSITQPGTGGSELMLDNNGDMEIAGMLTENSDRSLKENIKQVDENQILEKVAALPVSEWNYKKDKQAARHIGPMAQDFRAAFGLGDSDKRISPSDKIGVSLVAIKALNEKLTKKDAEIEDLKLRLQRMEAAVETLSKQ